MTELPSATVIAGVSADEARAAGPPRASRAAAAGEGEGWRPRTAARVTMGPRVTLLGHASPFADVIAGAAPLVHAVAGVTGLLTHAYSLIGASSVLIAAGPGRGPGIPPGL